MNASDEIAQAIHDGALRAVADRITELGSEAHPALVPIVAANVAMAAALDSLITVVELQRTAVMYAMKDRCEGGRRLEIPPAERDALPAEIQELRRMRQGGED
jgi:hypothetical protein